MTEHSQSNWASQHQWRMLCCCVRKYLCEYRSRSFKSGWCFLINLTEFPRLYLGSQNMIYHRAEHVMAVVPESKGIRLRGLAVRNLI
jgi:hypothetical protein